MEPWPLVVKKNMNTTESIANQGKFSCGCRSDGHLSQWKVGGFIRLGTVQSCNYKKYSPLLQHAQDFCLSLSKALLSPLARALLKPSCVILVGFFDLHLKRLCRGS